MSSKVIDISPGNLDSSLCFNQPCISHDYSTYKLNKQSDNIQAWCIPFPMWSQSIVPCRVLLLLDPHTEFSGCGALGGRFHLGALASGSWIALLHRRNPLAGSLVSVSSVVRAHPALQASVRLPAGRWAPEGAVPARRPRKKWSPASWNYLQAPPAFCPSTAGVRAWPAPRSCCPRKARVMVQMETQLQSIFEEVVVSGTARDPGRWLGEGGLGDSGSRNLARATSPHLFLVVTSRMCARVERFSNYCQIQSHLKSTTPFVTDQAGGYCLFPLVADWGDLPYVALYYFDREGHSPSLKIIIIKKSCCLLFLFFNRKRRL